ncbi:MAG: single-stranded-DNA-specific exonuclease RecJ [Chitinophagaceae bacterium]|nr:single-stranded-DNA-specific exonuclease RecJ [Chitinophagaceae bacterium]
MEKKWTLKEVDEERVKSLQQSLNIHPALCKLLIERQIESFEEAKIFFRTSPEQLHSPFLMKDMHKAIERIHRAIELEEKMLIYGDYDVDGTTAVAVVYSYFKAIYPQIEFYIPHRFTEGYGLSLQGVQYAIQENISLIITLDCGIKSNELIQQAANHGIEVIVCDHHLPGSELPPALAILNPKQADCPYPFKELCGCGIGYKLITAYAQQYQTNIQGVNQFLDLVATAIAADIVPINGENRTLCVLGLEKANAQPSIPLQALRQISELKKEFTITDLVFIIAPRVNAAGRMDDARKAVELFIAKDQVEAKKLATLLHENNNDRKDVDRSTTLEALQMLEEDAQQDLNKSTVVYKSDWHKGVVGIVASRLIEHHYKPTIVLTSSNGKITGSARSIKGFNMFEGLNQCADFLENYGGHYFAAGLTLKEENLTPFKLKFDEVVKSTVPAHLFTPEIEIDAEISLTDIHEKFITILDQFAPHGPENMKPIFLTRAVMDYKGLTSIVKEKHIRFVLYQQTSNTINGIGFNLAHKIDIVKSNSTFDILYHIEENDWNGQKSIQLKIIDIR